MKLKQFTLVNFLSTFNTRIILCVKRFNEEYSWLYFSEKRKFGGICGLKFLLAGNDETRYFLAKNTFFVIVILITSFRAYKTRRQTPWMPALWLVQKQAYNIWRLTQIHSTVKTIRPWQRQIFVHHGWTDQVYQCTWKYIFKSIIWKIVKSSIM